jgi:hypothetical protein
MPLLTRASTGPAVYRRGKFPVEYDEESQSGSRRSSRRDWSLKSGRPTRSTITPESSRSSRTSVTKSDKESDVSISTQDEREGRPSDRQERSLSPNQLRRRRRRRRVSPRQTPIYEEDADEAPKERRSLDERESPSRRSPERRDSGSSVQPESSDRRRVVNSLESPRPPNSRHKRYDRKMGESDSSKLTPRRNRASKRPYQPELVYERSGLRRSNTLGGSQGTSIVSSSSRRHSILGSFFGSSNQSAGPEKPVKM